MNSNKNQFSLSRFLLSLAICLALLVFKAPSSYAQAAPDLQGVNPDFAYWGEVIQLYGENFGSYVDDATTYVKFVSATTAEETIATVHFPPSTYWTDRSVRVDVPAGLAEGNYDIILHQGGSDTSARLFTVQDYQTPSNVHGTPDYTNDYIISNTQTINVSDAIRRIAQGMLLPSKETITELGRYLEDALVFKLDIGSEGSDPDSSKAQLEKIYEVARNISNTLFLFFIVISAFFLIFRVGAIPLSLYSIRQIVPRFFIAMILVNGGFFFSRILTDFTLILTHVILDQVAIVDTSQLAAMLLGDLRLSLFVLFMLGFYLLISSVIALVVILLILRVVAVWLMIAISPLAFILVVFPHGHRFAVNWFKRFLQLLVMGPMIAFLLFVGITLSQGASAIGNPDVLRAMIGTATLGLILATPMWVSGLASFIGQMGAERESSASSSRDSTTTVIKEREKVSEKTVERTDRVSINQRLGLQDIDVSNVLSKSPSIEKLEARIQNAIIHEENSTRQGNDATITTLLEGKAAKESAPAESPAAPAETSAPPAEKTVAPAPVAAPTSTEAKVNAAARPARTDNLKLQNAAQKLFASAPKTLLVNWLSDESKHALIRDGIVEAEGKLGGEKAVAIFDSPDGKKILGQMVEGESTASQQASANMISDVMLTYPDRISQVIEDSEHAPPPINFAAQVVLKAGIAKLGERLLADPNDERLQKAAERVVQYAPHLLTNILSMPSDTGAGFIRFGIDQVAANLGSQLLPLLAGRQKGTNDTTEAAQYSELSGLATQTLLFPEIHIEQLGQTPAEQAFVAVAATSDAPDSGRVRDRIATALETLPESNNLRSISSEIVKLSDQNAITSLPAPILAAAKADLDNSARTGAYDLGLLAKLLAAAPVSQLPTLSIPNDVFASGLGILSQQFSRMGIETNSPDLRARIMMVTPAAQLQAMNAAELTSLQTGLTELAMSDPELALRGTLKLLTALPADAPLSANLSGLVMQAWRQGKATDMLTVAEQGQVAGQLLLSKDPVIGQAVAQDSALQQSLIAAAYATQSNELDAKMRTELPPLIEQNPALALKILAASLAQRQAGQVLTAAEIEQYLAVSDSPERVAAVDATQRRLAAQHILEQPWDQLPASVRTRPDNLGRLLSQALSGADAPVQLDWLTAWAPQFAQLTVDSPALANSAAVEILAASDPIVIPPPPIVQTAYNGLVAHAADFDPGARQSAAIRLLTDQPTQDQASTTPAGLSEVLISALPVGAPAAERAAAPILAQLFSQPDILVELDLPTVFPTIDWTPVDRSSASAIKTTLLTEVLPPAESGQPSGLAGLLGKLMGATQNGQPATQSRLDLLAQIPLQDVPEIVTDPSAQASLSVDLLAHPERINNPEQAAKLLLLTPEADIAGLPWKLLKQVLEQMVKMDKESPLYKELQRRAELHPEMGKQSAGLPSTQPDAAAEATKRDQPQLPNISLIEKTPLDQLQSLPIEVIKQALEELQQRPDMIVPPELAAKMMKLFPLQKLQEMNQPLREATARYLMDKPDGSHTSEDAEIAARLVAATPSRYLIGLNQSILTLAATIAKSNLSFADRDQLQQEIGKELQTMIQQNRPTNEKTDAESKGDPKSQLSKPLTSAAAEDEDQKSGVFNIDI